MITPRPDDRKWNERSNAAAGSTAHIDTMFQMLFERSADAIVLFDPGVGVFVDCNEAAVALMRAKSKEQLLNATPAQLAPPFQPDGRPSAEVAAEIAELVEKNRSHRFEWTARCLDGTDIPLENLATAIAVEGRTLHVVVPRDITERKRTEQEILELNQTLEKRIREATAGLRASEAQFRTLVEHAPEAIVVFDGLTGRFMAVNENAVSLFGRPREELVQLTPADISPPCQPDGRPSAQVAKEKMQEALAGGMPVFEWVHRHVSGKPITSEVRLVQLPGEHASLLRASIIDHTERKRREQVLRATYEISEAVHAVEDLPSLYERIHRTIGGLMPADNFYIALYDAAAKTISFPYFVDEVGVAPEPFTLGTGLTSYVVRTGKSLLVGPEMNTRKRRIGNEVMFEGFPDLQYIESGNPAAIWLGVPLTAGGRTVGVMALQDYRDPGAYGKEEQQILNFVAGQIALAIERKRSQQALLESEAKFRALFEATSTGVMIHDDQQYLEVNPAIVRMLGYKNAADLVGKNPILTSPPLQPGGARTVDIARKQIAECQRTGTARFDWVARKADGSDLPVEVILTRIEMGGRQLIQAVVTDITTRKRAEIELWRALEHERELSQLKNNFVSMVSHEFRTPLGIIQSSAEILADYLDQLSLDDRREHLGSITRNTRRMGALMEEVLVLGRLDAGKMDFQPASIDLQAFCRRTTDEVQAGTDRQCPIELKVAVAAAAEARGDERLLGHIFTNLLSNAVKYSARGQPVEFVIDREGADAVCVIRDHGIGIPEEDQPRLFQAFYRGQNVDQRPGSGLGLVIVKRCLELHGGSIQLDSKPGKGTRVTVRLPLFPTA